MTKLPRLLSDFLQAQRAALSNTDRLFNCIKLIEGGSSKISAWSLSIIGGSFLVILSDSYVHPVLTKFKLAYLLFIVGWGFIGASIYYGTRISGSAIASDLHRNNEDQLQTIFKNCNRSFAQQLNFLNSAY